MNIMEAMKGDVLLGDGGMIIEARWRGYSTPDVIVSHTDVLQQIHTDYFRAGAQVLQALTWWTSRTQLDVREGWGNRLDEITRTAVHAARDASGGEAFIGGCVNQTGAGSWRGPMIYSPHNAESRARACDEWDEHIAAMVDAGVDVLIPETFARLDEARLCLSRCKKASVPTMVLMGGSKLTQDGATPGEAARILVDEGADVVGLVCNSDPAAMLPLILEMRAAVDVPVAYQPAGWRTNADGNWLEMRESMVVSGAEMAEYALKAKAEGINYIGACCGAGPEHIRAVARALDRERYPVV